VTAPSTAPDALDRLLAEDAAELDRIVAELLAEQDAALAPFRAQMDEDARELDRLLAELDRLLAERAADLGPFGLPTSTSPSRTSGPGG
jgi:hypothetical protein